MRVLRLSDRKVSTKTQTITVRNSVDRGWQIIAHVCSLHDLHFLRNDCKPLSSRIDVIFSRWTLLPEMDKGYCLQSALFIGTGDGEEDAVILVVGGSGGTGKEAALLTNRPHQTTAVQGNGSGQWRWQQLSPMQKKRDFRPGVLLLGGERVLVCGGGRKTAEILQLPRDDNDSKGVWTLLTQKMTGYFGSSYLVKFNHRVIAVGELFITMLLICQCSVGLS